jgi:hypothetical protein
VWRITGLSHQPRRLPMRERKRPQGKSGGGPARWSNIPCVKAYRNHLPKGQRGIEFTIAPTPGKGSSLEACWYEGTSGVRINPFGFAKGRGVGRADDPRHAFAIAGDSAKIAATFGNRGCVPVKPKLQGFVHRLCRPAPLYISRGMASGDILLADRDPSPPRSKWGLGEC